MQINIFDNNYDQKSNEIVLISKNEIGYKNLVFLANQVNNCVSLNPQKAIEVKLLEKYNEGLIVLGGGPENGYIGFPASRENLIVSKARGQILQSIFKNNFYIEIQRNGLERDKRAEPVLLNLAKDLMIPIVATNDSFLSQKKNLIPMKYF